MCPYYYYYMSMSDIRSCCTLARGEVFVISRRVIERVLNLTAGRFELIHRWACVDLTADACVRRVKSDHHNMSFRLCAGVTL